MPTPFCTAAITLLLSAPIAIASPPAGNNADQGNEGDLRARIALLDSLDAARVTHSAKDTELEPLLSELATQLPAPLIIDWHSLDRLGVDRDDPVSIDASALRASAALAAICLQLGDEFEHPVVEAGNGTLILTTIAGTADLRVTSIYDVRDLLTDGVTLPTLQAEPADPEAAAGSQPKPDQSDDADGGEVEYPVKPNTADVTPGQQLLLLLTDHVDPDAWVNFGGHTAKITDRDGILIVTAPASTHRLLLRALQALRAATPAVVEIQQTIIELPRASYDRIRRKFDAAGPEIAAALAESPDATTHWRATIITRVDEQAVVESTAGDQAVTDAAPAAASASAAHVSVAVKPSLDRITGLITLAVDAGQAIGADRRSVKTTLTLNPAQSTAILELAAAKDTPTTRVLVLSIKRQ